MREQTADRCADLSGGVGPKAAPRARPGGLLLIGIFKLVKSVFFFCVGIGAFHLMHQDLADAAMRLAWDLRRFDAEGRLTTLLVEKAALVDPAWLRRAEFFSFGYSALALTEGIGLMMHKVWAEFLTLSLTVMFLPWELYELARRPTWIRFGLLLINLAVLGYLLWLLDRKKKAA